MWRLVRQEGGRLEVTKPASKPADAKAVAQAKQPEAKKT